MGRGGSRSGAGRPGWKAKAEHCMRLDVRVLHRAGCLVPGVSGSWRWTRGEEAAGSIGMRAEALALCLLYSIDGRQSDQRIRIEKTACTYGGARPWFACPYCCRRVAVLYLRSGAFRCRHCARVAYTSQSEDALSRTWRKQHKAEAKIKKGIHEATFERLVATIEDCEARRDAALAVFVARRWPGMLRW